MNKISSRFERIIHSLLIKKITKNTQISADIDFTVLQDFKLKVCPRAHEILQVHPRDIYFQMYCCLFARLICLGGQERKREKAIERGRCASSGGVYSVSTTVRNCAVLRKVQTDDMHGKCIAQTQIQLIPVQSSPP